MESDFAILLCSTGVGMSIAANRFPGIYAALVWNSKVARLSKEDDNSNILVFPSDFVSFGEIHEMIDEWLTANFKGDKYQDRLNMIDVKRS